MQKETPWLKLCEVPCHCSMYPLGTIIITIIMNSQFYCQNWDCSTSQREREREREITNLADNFWCMLQLMIEREIQMNAETYVHNKKPRKML
jgi:hypothetical protein